MPENGDGSRIAELPGGKFLKFPAKTTDRDIARAVRRELGVNSQGELVLMEHIDDLIEGLQEQGRRHKEHIEEVSDALSANASRISAELSDAVRGMTKVAEAMDESLRKVTANQANLISRMDATMGQLNQTMDHALGETVGTMDDGYKVAAGIENAIRDMNTLVGALMRTTKEVSDLKKIRRKAYKNRDGSYTFETEFD